MFSPMLARTALPSVDELLTLSAVAWRRIGVCHSHLLSLGGSKRSGDRREIHGHLHRRNLWRLIPRYTAQLVSVTV